mmetsp:Transcript_2121/g.6125  ORF Transcript_2121/g.6125 Transcript_2121/m.6125 type:complete len:339 (-) Transcript_2121:81-1097(-)
MSDAAETVGGSGGADRPVKKQKCGENETAISDLGGPVEDEATARKKLQDAGFDPDSPQLLETARAFGWPLEHVIHFPMTYFCSVGDLKMCRYLLSNGASTTKTWDDDEDYDDTAHDGRVNLIPLPIHAAARGGQLHVCKWLCEHGGRGDIRKANDRNRTPLFLAVIQCQRETYRWLILNEALCPNDDGIVSMRLIQEGFSPLGLDERPQALEWAESAVRTHEGFMTFLMGTHLREVTAFNRERLAEMLHAKFHSLHSVNLILDNLTEDQQLLLWNNEQKRDKTNCVLQYLSGHPGIRQHIADMLGVVRGRELRIMRQLEVMLRRYLEEVPRRGATTRS